MKKIEFPTLFDRVVAAAVKGGQPFAFHDWGDLKQMIFQARRFVLDDGMSGFLGDIASMAFQAKGNDRQQRAIESMRVGARLPHHLTWIEYDLRRCHERLRSYPTGSDLVAPLEEIPRREGWLLERHSGIDTAFRATLFIDTEEDSKDAHGYDAWAFPWALCWTTDDSPIPWKTFRLGDQEMNTKFHSAVIGLYGYVTDSFGLQLAPELMKRAAKEGGVAKDVLKLMMEWAGTPRRMWALLSTINDLPIGFREVRQSKGYMARRNYHKFLDHKVVTLSVPQTQFAYLAKQVIAAARRRAHVVREHLRIDRFHPPSALCDHAWTTDEEGHLSCSLCKGRKLWIKEHQRGDASLGWVTHDYRVTRDASTTGEAERRGSKEATGQVSKQEDTR